MIAWAKRLWANPRFHFYMSGGAACAFLADYIEGESWLNLLAAVFLLWRAWDASVEIQERKKAHPGT